MRVLMVIRDDAEATLGGDTIQVRETRSALEALGHHVEVCGTSEVERAGPCDVAHVFNIQTAESSWRAFQLLERRDTPIVLSSIYWDMLDHWFDLAVLGLPRWRTLVSVLGRARARNLYVRWHRMKAPRTPEWRLQRALLERASRVLPNSQSEADLLMATFRLNGGFSDKVDVVPNGIVRSRFEAPQPSAFFLERYGVRDFVLEVGAISPVKNQLGLLDALADTPVPVVFIGQPAPAMPEYAERCRERAARRGNVVFVDRLPHEELPGIYALAAVHALPSWRETPGLASLEAAAAGCRVVSTSIGSASDYFGDLAWYCDPADVGSIRRAVEAALAAPRSTALRERVLSAFTWDAAGRATAAAYGRAAGRRSV